MGARRNTTKNRIPPAEIDIQLGARRRRSGQTKGGTSTLISNAMATEHFHAAINKERGTLLKADALLGCLVTAMEYGSDSANPIHYPDVAQVARDLVNHAVEALDPLLLQRHFSRDEIREHSGPLSGDDTPAMIEFPVSAWERIRQFSEPRARRSHGRRLHRRTYIYKSRSAGPASTDEIHGP